MKAVLTSKNKAKIAATKNILLELYPGLELETIDVSSGVPETPTSEDEGIKGCMNRIAAAKERIQDADLYIAMEGIISKNNYGSYISGWCVIDQPGKGRMSIGSSAKVQLPEFISAKIEKNTKLSDVVKEYYPSEIVDDMPILGSNGIISERMYTRVKEFEDALITTLGYLHNDKNFTG
jgi:inosine/xanthosine triphosphatase